MPRPLAVRASVLCHAPQVRWASLLCPAVSCPAPQAVRVMPSAAGAYGHDTAGHDTPKANVWTLDALNPAKPPKPYAIPLGTILAACSLTLAENLEAPSMLKIR